MSRNMSKGRAAAAVMASAALAAALGVPTSAALALEGAGSDGSAAASAVAAKPEAGSVNLSTLTVKTYDLSTYDKNDPSAYKPMPYTMMTTEYDGKSIYDPNDRNSVLMRWFATFWDGKPTYAGLDASGKVVLPKIPYYSDSSLTGGRFIGTAFVNDHVESFGSVVPGQFKFDEVMTEPGTLSVVFYAGLPEDPVGIYYGSTNPFPVIKIEPRKVTLSWSGADGRKPNDGGSVTATMPDGTVVSDDDVKVEVSGGDEQAEGRYTATAKLVGKDAWKYTLVNGTEGYVIGNPPATTDKPATTEPATTKPATTKPATTDKPAATPATTDKPATTPATTDEPATTPATKPAGGSDKPTTSDKPATTPAPKPDAPKTQPDGSLERPAADEEPVDEGDLSDDEAPEEDAALPQTDDPTPVAAIAGVGVTGVVAAVLGFLRRQQE